MKAKIISKLSKVVLGAALVVTFYYKWKGLLPGADTAGIIICYLTAYGIIAGTIDMNIMLDKFINICGKQSGGTNERKENVLPHP